MDPNRHGSKPHDADTNGMLKPFRQNHAPLYYRGLRRPLHRQSRMEPPPHARFAYWVDPHESATGSARGYLLPFHFIKPDLGSPGIGNWR